MTDSLFDGKSIVEQKQMISPLHRQVLWAPGVSSRNTRTPPLQISLMEKLISTHGFCVQKIL